MGALTFEPLISPALWMTLAIAVAALVFWYGWRRPGAVPRRRWAAIVVLMTASLALVLTVLLNPTWVEPVAPPDGKPFVTILVDGSASMATTDAADGHTRYQAAAQLAKAYTAGLGDRYEVRVATFTSYAKLVAPNELENQVPQGEVTDLAAALTTSMVDNRAAGQAVVLLSDGIHNMGGTGRVLDAVRLARAMACPVYTRTFGGDPAVKDLAIELRSPQEVAFKGQKVPVAVTLRQRGLAGGTATVILSHQGREMERRAVPIKKDDTVEVRYEVGQEKPGVYRYEVRAEPLPGEATASNNGATLVLRVVDKPVRVLLLEGKPYWDAKFLMRTLLADASLELDSVVRLGENRLVRRTLRRAAMDAKDPAGREEWRVVGDLAGLLTDAEQLRAYQIVVLGRDADTFLTDPALAQLRSWVSRDGGSLVCSRGQPTSQVNQRLAQLLPLRWVPARESRFRVNLTERGRDLRWLPASPGDSLAALPTLATASRPNQVKPVAVVLATAQGQEGTEPVVTYQPYGTGRVVVIEGSGMWRWAFLPPQQQKHEDVYRSLWHGLLRWLEASGDLLPGQKLALRGDRVSYGTTEPATATLLLREEGDRKQVPQIELRRDGIAGVKKFVPTPVGDEPGAFRVAFGKLPEGRYEARVAGAAEDDASARAAFDVRSFSEERLDLKARPDLMERIAAESGGAVLTGETPKGMIRQFQEHREQSRPVRVERVSAWDRWWVLAAALGLWATAWGLRRSGGLV